MTDLIELAIEARNSAAPVRVETKAGESARGRVKRVILGTGGDRFQLVEESGGCPRTLYFADVGGIHPRPDTGR